MNLILTIYAWILQMLPLDRFTASRTQFSSNLKFYSTEIGFVAAPDEKEAEIAFRNQYRRKPSYLVPMSPYDLGPNPSQGQPLTLFELARRMEDFGMITSSDRGYMLRYPPSFYDPSSVL